MITNAIAMANSRLAEIKTQIADLQTEASEIENALAVMSRFVPVWATPETAPPIRDDVARGIETQAKHAISLGFQMGQAEFEVLATRAINEAGRPLTRTQILAWLENNGTPMPGTDASKNAGTKLWRARERFVNIRGAGYWFKDRPCPAVGYDPRSVAAALQQHFATQEDFEKEEEATA